MSLALWFSTDFLNIYISEYLFSVYVSVRKTKCFVVQCIVLIRAELKSQPWKSCQCPLSAPSSGTVAKQGNICCSPFLLMTHVHGIGMYSDNSVIDSYPCCNLNSRFFPTLFIKLDSNIEFPCQLPTPLGRSGRIKAFFPTRCHGESCSVLHW